jgi:hypothetical protein
LVRGTATLVISLVDLANVLLGVTEVPDFPFPDDTKIHEVERIGDDLKFYMSSEEFDTENEEAYGMRSERLVIQDTPS